MTNITGEDGSPDMDCAPELSLRDCRQSFRFSELIQSLDAHDDSALELTPDHEARKNTNQSSAVSKAEHTSLETRTIPGVQLAKSSSTPNGGSRSGLFKRLFSNSLSQTSGDLRSTHGASSATGSIRSKRSGLFKRLGNSQQADTEEKSSLKPSGLTTDSPGIFSIPKQTSEKSQDGVHQDAIATQLAGKTISDCRLHENSETLMAGPESGSTESGIDLDSEHTFMGDGSVQSYALTQQSIPLIGSPRLFEHKENQADQPTTASSARLEVQPAYIGTQTPDSADLDMANSVLIKATSMYEWQDSLLEPQDYAVFLSIEDAYNRAVRQAYFDLFDFQNMSLLDALRALCRKLYIRGETQEIDRLIESFAHRWRVCNMQDKYISKDIAYIIAFALIALNTDLHVANIESDQRMSRTAFVRNTMYAINTGYTNFHDGKQSRPDATRQSTSTSLAVSGLGREVTETQSIRVVPRSVSSATIHDSPVPSLQEFDQTQLYEYQGNLYQNSMQDAASSYSLSPVSRNGSTRKLQDFSAPRAAGALTLPAQNAHLKEILQDLYQSVKAHRIRQPDDTEDALSRLVGRTRPEVKSAERHDTVTKNHMLQAMESGLETPLSARFSINRRRPGSAGGNYSYNRSSSTLSLLPSASDAGVGKSGSYHHSIGFASSLNKVMIREEPGSPLKSEIEVIQAIEQTEFDNLTLSGPPFGKEGRLYHRLIGTAGKRRFKQKGWSNELFAVLGTGSMHLFDFSSKSAKSTQALYGGGDWTRNARGLMDIDLIQAQACRLPEDQSYHGRRYVWQLLLSSGEAHLFEVGTEELVQEWLDTANFWAAKITKEPLLGAVDNADYGWGACLAILEVDPSEQDTVGLNIAREAPLPVRDTVKKQNALNAIKPGDRAYIQTWQPDPIPLMRSDLSIQAQLESLQKYVGKLQDELELHRSRLALIRIAFSPRHPNGIKALDNHKQKEEYLLRQISKYEVYVTSLENGIDKAEKVNAERDNAQLRVLRDG